MIKIYYKVFMIDSINGKMIVDAPFVSSGLNNNYPVAGSPCTPCGWANHKSFG
jgi:hypothetical protein